MDFGSLWSDQRGLTGSELGAVRIAEELAAMGHDVTLRTVSSDKEWHGFKIASIDEPIQPCDIALAVNEPDLLRGAPAGAFRAVTYWLNDMSFLKKGFADHVDLFISPSEPHREQMFTNPKWRRVATHPNYPDGEEQYEPNADKWAVVELGCDPGRHDECAGCGEVECNYSTNDCGEVGQRAPEKIPGRVIYSSSPDRGLHWLLQEWPIIKLQVPHATLHIFYRLEPWIRGFDKTPYFPPIEPNRARALYVQEALQRLSDPKWGITLRDSVSRETIEREMAQAEVMAYPCDTLAWSEGFSCSVLEGCAARACPITTDCDALGGVYGDALPLVKRNGRDPREWVPEWRKAVIGALGDASYREHVNTKARTFAETRTWKRTAENILNEIEKRRHGSKEAA